MKIAFIQSIALILACFSNSAYAENITDVAVQAEAVAGNQTAGGGARVDVSHTVPGKNDGDNAQVAVVARVEVAVAGDIEDGSLRPVGQVGALVKLPGGYDDMAAIVGDPAILLSDGSYLTAGSTAIINIGGSTVFDGPVAFLGAVSPKVAAVVPLAEGGHQNEALIGVGGQASMALTVKDTAAVNVVVQALGVLSEDADYFVTSKADFTVKVTHMRRPEPGLAVGGGLQITTLHGTTEPAQDEFPTAVQGTLTVGGSF